MTEREVDPKNIDWDGVEQSAVASIRLLKLAWECSHRDLSPEIHAKMVDDLYTPIVHTLAQFCMSVQVDALSSAASSSPPWVNTDIH